MDDKHFAACVCFLNPKFPKIDFFLFYRFKKIKFKIQNSTENKNNNNIINDNLMQISCRIQSLKINFEHFRMQNAGIIKVIFKLRRRNKKMVIYTKL